MRLEVGGDGECGGGYGSTAVGLPTTQGPSLEHLGLLTLEPDPNTRGTARRQDTGHSKAEMDTRIMRRREISLSLSIDIQCSLGHGGHGLLDGAEVLGQGEQERVEQRGLVLEWLAHTPVQPTLHVQPQV